MSKIEKLLRDPPELNYDDVCYILNYFGFQKISNKGSHHQNYIAITNK